jgi:hypothetical protein
MCKRLYGKYACGCIVELIRTSPCGLKVVAEKLRKKGKDPNGARLRNLEHAYKERKRREYKLREFVCTPCYVAMHK